jgi:glutamate-1-semialdehyde 2,1-aminomutase
MEGIAAAGRRSGTELQVSGLPSAFHTCFANHPIHDYATYASATNPKQLGLFLSSLLERGIRPTSRGTWFVSAAHTEDDVALTLDAVEQALQQVA